MEIDIELYIVLKCVTLYRDEINPNVRLAARLFLLAIKISYFSNSTTHITIYSVHYINQTPMKKCKKTLYKYYH